MKEIWQDVKGYEGLYQVSNLGNIRSLMFINNKIRKSRIKEIKKNITKKNRVIVHLYKNCERKAITVHRLVAIAFLENNNSYPEINHIDGNPQNNNVKNLEWCSKSYNCKHAYINKLSNLLEYNSTKMKPIIRDDGKEYNNSYEASKDLHVSVCSIRDVLKGRIKTCKGYKFIYKEG